MRIANILRIVGAIVAAVLLAGTAHAQLFRAYLSPTGNDASPCTLPAPCRLLPAALTAVVDGGEIWMLGSANYNTATVTIDKSVSILAVPGVVGSLIAVNGPAISITADSLLVALRNLVIVPLVPVTAGSRGVELRGASALTIEDTLIANMISSAIDVRGAGTVKIANATIRNNAGFAVYAVDGAQVNISGTKMLGNGSGGVAVWSSMAITTTVVVSDSIISGGADGAFAFTDFSGANARIVMTRCTIEGTGNALRSQTNGFGSPQITVSGSMITNNIFAWVQTNPGTVITTLGNNHIQDNANLPTSMLTSASLQ